ncbi:unnamed protein product [Photorhabdus laumondii subsp. laumondii TTO1]|uniref:Photorhabdus luminescens subsp. laumondii TTO1 complete genome segment 12/17 n=1 Tax=Photorhabdus laumondii subsp. laumondii (strain DSM 15139 / CIP 105565 / TT01) TaxID=243265 RepID=Q7N1F2_PHOLL|nr:unnamed protein product [Photorhabdus laumondii subsp. laumondii TTO1]
MSHDFNENQHATINHLPVICDSDIEDAGGQEKTTSCNCIVPNHTIFAGCKQLKISGNNRIQ